MDLSTFKAWIAAIKARPKTAFVLSIAAAILSAVAYYQPDLIPDFENNNEPPVELMGWAGPDAAEKAYAELAPTLPKFAIEGHEDSRGAIVHLWDFAKQLNGEHIPTATQLVGDCVSQGAANAVNYLAAMEIVRLGEHEELRLAFAPYIYGSARAYVGGGRIPCNQDGAVGVWAAKALQQYGVLAADAEGCPEYSAKIARAWGCDGPPDQFQQLARAQIVKTFARVTTYDQVRDALANGYPVTVASDVGFRMKGQVEDGKLWGIPKGNWAHQMCFVGIDDTADVPRFAGGGKGAVYCLNSWGPDAHGESPDGAPPGGFWIGANVVDRMVGQGDSFAFSQFEGFKSQDLDFDVLLSSE
ncbi:hypothetical protein Pan216_30150 [Planctomycetes bacterium Pan216]|uniref:Peptidase C1A papain C-terminal domain-containing protein n=1 Tax=Kolteria novifilia TaxID=2527975 RepID=A0A518B592_9BACT|nr:hypothetical protein Pan216_30150 [Planctomycetes bacterium Pan216]